MSAERQWPDEAAIEAISGWLGGDRQWAEHILDAAVAASPVVPEAALRTWIEEQRRSPARDGDPTYYRRYHVSIDDLSVFLDSLHAELGTDRSER